MCTFHNYLILLWYFALNTHDWSLFFNRTPFRVNSFIFSLTPIRSLFVLLTLYLSIYRSQSLSPSLLLPLYPLLKGFPLYVFPLPSSFPIYHFFQNSISFTLDLLKSYFPNSFILSLSIFLPSVFCTIIFISCHWSISLYYCQPDFFTLSSTQSLNGIHNLPLSFSLSHYYFVSLSLSSFYFRCLWCTPSLSLLIAWNFFRTLHCLQRLLLSGSLLIILVSLSSSFYFAVSSSLFLSLTFIHTLSLSLTLYLYFSLLVSPKLCFLLMPYFLTDLFSMNLFVCLCWSLSLYKSLSIYLDLPILLFYPYLYLHISLSHSVMQFFCSIFVLSSLSVRLYNH